MEKVIRVLKAVISKINAKMDDYLDFFLLVSLVYLIMTVY